MQHMGLYLSRGILVMRPMMKRPLVHIGSTSHKQPHVPYNPYGRLLTAQNSYSRHSAPSSLYKEILKQILYLTTQLDRGSKHTFSILIERLSFNHFGCQLLLWRCSRT